MSSPPAPRKPPRGVKYSRDTSGSGLLVAVIKTLDASETNEERQQEKLKIEKEFKKADNKLNDLVAKHDSDLTQVMQLFGQISNKITNSRTKIRTVKENLLACKQLLRCRREEIQKLYKDAMQQKYTLEMLEQIDELRKVPSKVQSYSNKRHYLHATKVLVKAIDLSNGRLRDVDGLSDLRQDLDNRKNQLYLKMIAELNRHLYHLSTSEVLSNFQRHGSSTRRSDNNNLMSPFQRNVMRKSTERAEANAKVRKALFEMAQGFDVDKTEVIDDSELLDIDLSTSYFIGIIVECVALLKKVPESFDAIRSQIQPELLTIVTRTTQHLVAMTTADGSSLQIDVQNHPLLELLNLIHKQFKLIANSHNLLLKNYLNVTQRHGIVVKPYDIAEYWGQAQAVLQLVLTDYLDIQNSSGDDQADSTFNEQTNNFNSYFNRRKIPSRKTLFHFDKTTYVSHDGPKEHRRNASDISNDELLYALSTGQNKTEKTLVCNPDPALIRRIYLPLLSYTHEIEEMIKTKPSQSNAFNEFLNTHIRDIFLAKGHNRNLQMTIESLTKNHDAWRAIISPEEMKSMGLSRPLLQSTVLVEQKITETKNLIQDLPNYSEDLLKMVCSLLKTYRETCQAAYRGIVQPETEEKRIYSVAWLKDEDISRFLKTLPNWTDLKSSRSKLLSSQDKKLLKSSNLYITSEEESPTQVQQRNMREAEMLTSNLGEGFISQQEILSDIGILKELAILQESMEWFSHRITEFANDLKKPITNRICASANDDIETPVTIQDGTIKVLTNLALEFDDLANTCLLVLHLEVRVQCFHYLRSSEKNANKFNKIASDSLEPDSKVLKLTKVLSEMDEALNATLHPRKTKYIFEGLAHLAARILIMASNSLESIDQASVQRKCRNAIALQQTLSSITATREVALDNARNFYEMLYMDPEEILANIIEKGAQFTEMQYLNALQISCKGKGISDSNTIATYQQKLSDILGTKPSLGITV